MVSSSNEPAQKLLPAVDNAAADLIFTSIHAICARHPHDSSSATCSQSSKNTIRPDSFTFVHRRSSEEDEKSKPVSAEICEKPIIPETAGPSPDNSTQEQNVTAAANPSGRDAFLCLPLPPDQKLPRSSQVMFPGNGSQGAPAITPTSSHRRNAFISLLPPASQDCPHSSKVMIQRTRAHEVPATMAVGPHAFIPLLPLARQDYPQVSPLNGAEGSPGINTL